MGNSIDVSDACHMENLILGGASIEKIALIFPQYDLQEIEEVYQAIASYCWS